ncbi:glycosyl hydrolase family 18 protein, partial [Paenibacillus pini]
FYSHMWTDVTSKENGGLGQPATGSGNTPTYNDILVKYNAANGYKRYWDDAAKAPYLFNGSTFISYDDPQSLYEKAKYVLDKKLGGAMFWEYSNDSTGTLLNALADGLKGNSYEPEIQALEAPDASNEPQTNEDLETPEAVEVPVQ